MMPRFTPRTKSRGIALMTALTISAILFVLASAFLVHLREDFHAHRQRQWGVQAEWNARAALETYLYTRKLPKRDAVTKLRTFHYEDPSSLDFCNVYDEQRGLRFEGVSHGIQRSILFSKDGSGRIIRILP